MTSSLTAGLLRRIDSYALRTLRRTVHWRVAPDGPPKSPTRRSLNAEVTFLESVIEDAETAMANGDSNISTEQVRRAQMWAALCRAALDGDLDTVVIFRK